MSRYVSVFLIVTAFLLAASASWAQAAVLPAPDQVRSAWDQLLNQGILGILVIIEAVVIALLVREVKSGQQQVLQWAVQTTESSKAMEQALLKTTEQMARNAEQLARNEATMAQVLTVLSKR
jgi:hypothetical protein